ncbi:MAG: maleylpyruvate isomerase family mycothiol-dependent enzyme [Actinobacteria bacterium]|nr:maleylpyruvate isomerase family mycothiol-dependent enzyme [Actinomycetota bacterium]
MAGEVASCTPADAALSSLVDDVTALSRDAPLDARVPGLEWNVGDVLAHLAVQVERFRDFVTGDRSPDDDVAVVPDGPVPVVVAEVNRRLIASVDHRDAAVLNDRLRAAVADYLSVTATVPRSTPFRSWECGTDVGGATAILVAEMLVHGLDLARGLGTAWRIVPSHASLALPTVWALLPAYLDPVATRHVRASLAFAPRGMPGVRVSVDGGVAEVVPDVGPVDCRIHARPDDLLLLSFGRVALGGLVKRGRLWVSGRRPWMGLPAPSWFLPP